MAVTPPTIDANASLKSKIPTVKYCFISYRIEAMVTMYITNLGNLVGRINSNKENPST